MSIPRIAIASSLALSLAVVGACTDDPQYVQPTQALEANPPGGMGGAVFGEVDIPVRLEREDELMDRQALEAEIGAPVPFVTIDDVSVSVEWTIKNLSDQAGTARVILNGGNETWFYIPSNFQLVAADGEVEEEAPPALQGDIPMIIEAGETLSGVFREDQVRELAIDIELITRNMYNPVAAALEINEDTKEMVDMATGATVPLSAFGAPIRVIMEFESNQHMVLEYTVRVRDHRGVLHEDLLAAAPEELTLFNPAEFVPAGLAPSMP